MVGCPPGPLPAGSGARWRPDARAIRRALGALWLLDAVLQLQPAFFHRGFALAVESNASGQPPALAGSYVWLFSWLAPHILAANVAIILIQTGIGLALLSGRAVRAGLVASLIWSPVVWWVGEGFGGLFTGRASQLTGAPGPVLLYAGLAVLIWPRRAGTAAATEGTGNAGTGVVPGSTGAQAGGAGGGRTAASSGLLGDWGAWGAWALLWLGSAALSLQAAVLAPGELSLRLAHAPLGDHLQPVEPHVLVVLDATLARAVAGHGVQLGLALAALEALVGLGALSARFRRSSLVAGCALGLLLWVVAGDLGGLFSGSATDVGLGPLIVLLAITAWPATPAIPRRGLATAHAPSCGTVRGVPAG